MNARVFYVLILLGFTLMRLPAQVPEDVIIELLNSYREEVARESGSGITFTITDKEADIYPGRFISDILESFLCVVPVLLDGKEVPLLFVATDNFGTWKASGWYEFNLKPGGIVDVDNDGIEELIFTRTLEGGRETSYWYFLYALKDDMMSNLYANKGFRMSDGNLDQLPKGTLIAKTYDVFYEDLDGDGLKEITERTTKEYWDFQDDNRNLFFNEPAQQALSNSAQTESIYQLQEGSFVKVEEQ